MTDNIYDHNWVRDDSEQFQQDDAVYFREVIDGVWTGRMKTVYKDIKWEDGTTLVIYSEPPKWIVA